jgi:uncharacterized RDD family membrane protein YckC
MVRRGAPREGRTRALIAVVRPRALVTSSTYTHAMRNTTHPLVRDTQPEDASRLRRLFAFGIDQALALGLLMLTALGLDDGYRSQDEAFEIAMTLLALFGVFQLCLLGVRRQTLGKMALGIEIVKSDGTPCAGFIAIVRHLVANVAHGYVPITLAADAASIVGPQRRCLHDFIFNTRVVRVASESATDTRTERPAHARLSMDSAAR